MEKKIKLRTAYRSSLTKQLNKCELLIQARPSRDEKLAELEVLLDAGDRLFQLDNDLEDYILGLSDGEDQIETCDSYRRRFVKMKTLLTCSEQADEVKASNKVFLPKLELFSFDGNAKNWLKFWGSFQRIHNDHSITNIEKLQYLQQCTTAKAYELVCTYPLLGENYTIALNNLKERFAKDGYLIEIYVRELLQLVLSKVMFDSDITLSTLVNKLESHLRALETLGVTSEKYAAMLFPLVESSIPEETLKVWQRQRSNYMLCTDTLSEDGKSDINTSENNLTELMKFLSKEVDNEERLELTKVSFNLHAEKQFQTKMDSEKRHYTAETLLVTKAKSSYKLKCIFCANDHKSTECMKARKMSMEERKQSVQKSGVCYFCLLPNHLANQCNAFICCFMCNKRHSTIMCHKLSNIKIEENNNKLKNKDDDNNKSFTLLTKEENTNTYLQTLMVWMVNMSNNTKIKVRILLDTGSQHSYVLKKTINNIDYKPIRQIELSHGLFGGEITKKQNHKMYKVILKNMFEDTFIEMDAFDQNVICSQVPRINKIDHYSILSQNRIQLSDVGENSPDIEMLVGADNIAKILTGRLVKLNDNMVVVETLLGWALMGSSGNPCGQNTISSLCLNNLSIEDLWSLEAIGIKDTYENDEISEVTEHFKSNIHKDSNERYEVKLPFICEKNKLPCNRSSVEKKLFYITKRLKGNGQYDQYNAVILEWLEKGIIEKVESKDTLCYFLPHHPVFKTDSLHTKVRPVFDGSMKNRLGYSLNDCLQKGPNLIHKIPQLLMKFRTGFYGIIADIEKAFLQIGICESDRDILRFLWWSESGNEIQEFRHARVVFGLRPSPYLLAATIEHHLDTFKEHHLKSMAEKLKYSFYVDNLLLSVNHESEINIVKSAAEQIMLFGKFRLRDWVTNYKNHNFQNLNLDVAHVLGLLWDYKEDSFKCNLMSDKVEVMITRRKLLSASLRVWDPIGFTAPVGVLPKILLQESWKLKSDWDEELPERITKKFLQWIKQLSILKNCTIPRCLYLFKENVTVQMHIFCDASKLAYGSCVFVREESNDGINVNLVLAKSRITPIKDLNKGNVSIPRLELLAAVVGVRLYCNVKDHVDRKIDKVYFWSDSQVVLAWIKNKEMWSRFVTNRVTEIRKDSNIDDWVYIQSQHNAADILSRGCDAKTLVGLEWWKGPRWMYEQESMWPRIESFDANNYETNIEKRSVILCSTTNVRKPNDFNETLFRYFFSFTKTVRMVAWILRFKKNSFSGKENRIKGELKTEEYNKAKIIVIKFIQQDINLPEIKNLEVFYDKEGIIRVKTKLNFSAENENIIFPILLPPKHKMVYRFISEKHRTLMHPGPQTLMTLLREEFWIPRCRQLVKKVINACCNCQRFKSKKYEANVAPLPPGRVSKALAFEVVGVDLAGPLFLKTGEKVWIVLFTCALYRAIHLELTESLSTESFIMALRRFIARRGRCRIIYSDNGTNFRGLFNLKENLDWQEVEKVSSVRNITWKFSVPSAPWWGGFWERMVRSVKELLRRNLGKSCVSYEEMYTIMCDVESLVNNRPLTYIADDDEFTPIKPINFIQDLKNNETSDLDIIEEKQYLSKRMKYVNKLREDLRDRFMKEYVRELVQFKRTKNKGELKINQVVMIETDQKRIFWPLGRIEEIIKGKDGIGRMVRLKTVKGELIRPVQRIYPLEVDEDESQFERCEIEERMIEEEELDKSMEIQVPTITTNQDESEKEEIITKTRCGRQIRQPIKLNI